MAFIKIQYPDYGYDNRHYINFTFVTSQYNIL